jgi:hypothetical protein
MSTESQLREKLRKIEALFAGEARQPGTALAQEDAEQPNPEHECLVGEQSRIVPRDTPRAPDQDRATRDRRYGAFACRAEELPGGEDCSALWGLALPPKPRGCVPG